MSSGELTPEDVDVVFQLDAAERPGDIDLVWRDGKRIGNNRFGFIVANHTASFVEATNSGNNGAVEGVVDRIVDIIRGKDNMNARFLGRRTEKSGEHFYTDLEDGPDVQRIIWRILRYSAEKTSALTAGTDDSQLSWSIENQNIRLAQGQSIERSDTGDGVTASTKPTPINKDQKVLSESERSRKRRALLSARPQKRLSSSSTAGAQGRPKSDPDDVATASVQFVDKANQEPLHVPKFYRTEELDTYDVVVCGYPPEAVKEDATHVGNNRFRVIANMRRERYFAASEREKDAIARAMYEMMDSYTPKGRMVSWHEPTGSWKEHHPKFGIQITRRTLDEACIGLANDKLKAPVEDIANKDIDSLRSAAVASLQERMEKKQMMRNLEGRGAINKNLRDKNK